MIARMDSSGVSVSKWGQLIQNRSFVFDNSRPRYLDPLRLDLYEFARHFDILTWFDLSIELGSSHDTSQVVLNRI